MKGGTTPFARSSFRYLCFLQQLQYKCFPAINGVCQKNTLIILVGTSKILFLLMFHMLIYKETSNLWKTSNCLLTQIMVCEVINKLFVYIENLQVHKVLAIFTTWWCCALSLNLTNRNGVIQGNKGTSRRVIILEYAKNIHNYL